MDRDDPTGDSFGTGDTGDWENRDGFPANIVCQTPIGIQAQVRSGSDGSTEVTHFDNEQGNVPIIFRRNNYLTRILVYQ